MDSFYDAFEMWSLWQMMRISWTKRLSNEIDPDLAGSKRELFQFMHKRELSYFGK